MHLTRDGAAPSGRRLANPFKTHRHATRRSIERREDDGPEQHRTHQRPSCRSEPPRNRGGKSTPKHLVIASLMVESKRETWHDIVRRAEDAGSDMLELNFGCPHRNERARNGRSGRPGPGIHGNDYVVGQGSCKDSSDFKIDAQRHRHHTLRLPLNAEAPTL